MEYYRHLLRLSYKGSNYHGWQKQPNAITIQEMLNKSISTLTGEEIDVVGAGRTDTGVHARNYVAHFDTAKLLKYEPDKFIYKLNSILPKDIAINNINRVSNDFHARFSALSRSYYYVISFKKDVFSNEYCWQLKQALDMEKIKIASSSLLSIEDFTSFSKLHTDVKTNLCRVFNVRWIVCKNRLLFYIEADRFLRNMVRAIVGTLVDIGKGKLTEDSITTIAKAKDRSLASASAPAKGLFFNEAKYNNIPYF